MLVHETGYYMAGLLLFVNIIAVMYKISNKNLTIM